MSVRAVATSRIDAPQLDASPGDSSTGPQGRRISMHQSIAEFIALDCVLIVICGVLPLEVRALAVGEGFALGGLPAEANVIPLSLALFLACQKSWGGYRTQHMIDQSRSLQRLMLSLFSTFSVLMALGAAAKVTQDYSRLWFFSWVALAFIALPGARLMAFRRLRRAFRTGDYVYRAMSVGALCDPLEASEIDRMSKGLSKALPPARLHGLDEIASLAALVRDKRIDEIYVTVPWALAPEVFRRLDALRYLSANIYVLPAVSGARLNFVRARKRGEGLQIQVLDRPIGGWNSWLKRWFDIAAAGTALVLLAPVMAVISLAILIESRGPILFRQPRNGFNGGVFELLKFRSMYAEHADLHAGQQTGKRDQRVTRVGRFIRRTSLDELPQMINVLKGEMSIVGPRPHALKTSAEGKPLADAVSDYAFRHRVRPGITGWAQVNGLRGELDSIHKLRQRVQFDMEYIENWSLGFDVHIVLRTLRLMFHDPYAY